MATFAEFAFATDRREVILAEITPSVTVTAWGFVSGNVWQNVFPGTVATDRITGGVYRRVVGVRQDDTDLVEVASLAACQAAPGSFYWDQAVLRVHTTTGATPTGFTMQAFVTFYLSNAPVTLNRVDADASTAIRYSPWLSGDVPGYESVVEDVLFGSKISASGELEFVNAGGAWFTIVATNGDYNWKNKKVRFFVGGAYGPQSDERTLLRSQYAAIMTMEIDDLACDEEHVTLTLKAISRRGEREIPVTPYFESDYPNMGEGVRGTRKWIGYGRATTKPDLTDTVDLGGLGLWTIADAEYQEVHSVHTVTAINKSTGARTQLSVGVDYGLSNANTQIQIVNPTYVWTNYDLEVDATGQVGLGIGGVGIGGMRGYLSTFAEIVQDLLVHYVIPRKANGALDYGQIDVAAFAAAHADATEELSLWIKSPRSINSVLSTSEPEQPSLEKSVFGTVQQTLTGLWTCWIWDPAVTGTPIEMRKEDFLTFRHQPKLESVFKKTIVNFNYNHAAAEWPSEERSDDRTRRLSETEDEISVYTYLRGASDAQTLAQRFQLVSGSLSTEIEFEERGAKLATSLAGDKVLITYDPAPDPSGKFEAKPFEIIRLSKSYSPKITVMGRFGDLKGIGPTIGHWAGPSAPNWNAATTAERAASGFWTDDDGYANFPNADSLNKSKWW